MPLVEAAFPASAVPLTLLRDEELHAMPSSISCPKCKSVLKLKAPAKAKRVRCPKCEQVFAIKPPKARQESDASFVAGDDFDDDFGSAPQPRPARSRPKQGPTKRRKKSKKRRGAAGKGQSEDGEQGRSLVWMVTMLLIVVTGFGWAFAAAGYAHTEEGWRAGIDEDPVLVPVTRRGRGAAALWIALVSAGDFTMNALKQIPNAPAVLGHLFRKQLWLVIVIGLVYGAVVLLGWGGRRLEKQWADDQRRMY